MHYQRNENSRNLTQKTSSLGVLYRIDIKLSRNWVSTETPQPSLKDDLLKNWQFKKAHPQELIIGDTTKEITTRSKLKSFVNLAFISQIKPKNIDDALCDEFWVLAMQEELNQFERNKV